MTLNIKNISNDSKVVGKLLEPLFYYDIFSYPLSASEILQFSTLSTEEYFGPTEFNSLLDHLVTCNYIFHFDGYYMLDNNPEWVTNRKENNKRAVDFLKIAGKMTLLMSRFPFVRAIFISGSLIGKIP